MPIAIHPPVKGLVHNQVLYESNHVMGKKESESCDGGKRIYNNLRSFAIWVTDIEKESTTISDHLPSG
jgi:hypothetical protein